jgi:hypothetical protein
MAPPSVFLPHLFVKIPVVVTLDQRGHSNRNLRFPPPANSRLFHEPDLDLQINDAHRIALMGWAVGGRATLYAVDTLYLAEIRPTPFKAAVALYPLCLYGDCAS